MMLPHRGHMCRRVVLLVRTSISITTWGAKCDTWPCVLDTPILLLRHLPTQILAQAAKIMLVVRPWQPLQRSLITRHACCTSGCHAQSHHTQLVLHRRLSYAVYKAPNPTDVITRLSANFTVPPKPDMPDGSPAFWFGVQTATGDGALIQPIMSKWLGDSW